jgi:cation diffusion facilitator CzcD-associated flavoprotein CzcO
MTHTEVLITGAGPTGLVLAHWLTRLGVRLRIIDKTAEPGTTSRAPRPAPASRGMRSIWCGPMGTSRWPRRRGCRKGWSSISMLEG